MSTTRSAGRIVPIALGVAMVAIIVAAGLTPNTGAVPAQSNCPYGQCVAGTNLPWWVVGVIAIVIVAALAAALVLLRRRRTPPASGTPSATPSQGPTAGAMGGTAPPPPPPPAAAPAYLETPEDVGATLPHVPTAAPVGAAVVAGGAGAAAGAGAASEGEPDIDSLMAELDKISGEILKRPKGATDKKPATPDDD